MINKITSHNLTFFSYIYIPQKANKLQTKRVYELLTTSYLLRDMTFNVQTNCIFNEIMMH